MTRKEAINHLTHDWIITPGGQVYVDGDQKDDFLESVGMGIMTLKERGTGCECCLEDKAVYWQDDQNNVFVDRKGEMLITVKDKIMRIKVTHCPMCGRPLEGRFEIVPEKEANEPLTLEQLREMDGEPVWGKSLITGKPGEWFILRVVEMSKTWFIACAGAEQGFGDKDTYGETWVAYRRPPEGEKKKDGD